MDRVTGVLENCDGTRSKGGERLEGDRTLLPWWQVFAGQVVRRRTVRVVTGLGPGGNWSPLAGVVTTFASCADHIEWVTKGSSGFQAEGAPPTGTSTSRSPPTCRLLRPALRPNRSRRYRLSSGSASAEPTRLTVLADCGLVEAPAEAGEESTATTTGEAGAEGRLPRRWLQPLRRRLPRAPRKWPKAVCLT